MKQNFILIYIFLTISIISAQTRVAVLPFTADDYDSRAKATYLTEVFTAVLCSNGTYTVLERLALDKVISEMRLQNSNDFDESTAAEIGKLAGAEKIFMADIYHFGKGYAISLRCVDIQTGAISFAKKGNARNMPELEMVTKKIASQISQGNTTEAEVSIGLTKFERQFATDYLHGKWGIRSTDKANMRKYFYRHFISGLVLAGTGATFLTAGAIITPVLCSQTITEVTSVERIPPRDPYTEVDGVITKNEDTIIEHTITVPDETCIAVGESVGTLLLLGAAIMLPVSLVPLIFSKMIYSIYHKSTGEKLLATFTGGYNWERKELTFAMNIKF